ncbi:extensin-like [Benincasa hispida]|uniref:extensin-like n=1 Tax=Benincasa hispida TaxID=102211 RepID=UPI0018FFA736|nr:extensin-like [Benincasa hispida]
MSNDFDSQNASLSFAEDNPVGSFSSIPSSTFSSSPPLALATKSTTSSKPKGQATTKKTYSKPKPKVPARIPSKTTPLKPSSNPSKIPSESQLSKPLTICEPMQYPALKAQPKKTAAKPYKKPAPPPIIPTIIPSIPTYESIPENLRTTPFLAVHSITPISNEPLAIFFPIAATSASTSSSTTPHTLSDPPPPTPPLPFDSGSSRPTLEPTTCSLPHNENPSEIAGGMSK